MTNIKRESICRHIKQIIVMLLLLSLVTTVFPFSVFAEERKANKVVRVGWHEQPYFITDENGRYSGYTYDYQQKISAYTGWIYEYVSGSWSELLQMLKDGEIDMLGNVSYTEERANDMLYSSLPMGTESYYLFASQKNKDIRMNDYSSLNGKKIGVASGNSLFPIVECSCYQKTYLDGQRYSTSALPSYLASEICSCLENRWVGLLFCSQQIFF